MALNFYELKDSRPVERTVQSATVTLRHIGFYSTDETAVYAAYKSLTGSVFDNLPRQRITCTPQGAGVWMCEAEYGLSATTQTDSPTAPDAPDDSTALGPEYTFDITAQQVHITQSKATRYRWGNVAADRCGIALSVNNTDNKTVFSNAPDTGSALGGDVGKKLIIGGAAPWVNGVYDITAVSGAAWVLATSPGPVNTAGGYWTVWDGTSVGGASNWKQAIGVTQDRVEGCDIYYPHMEFGLTEQVYPFVLPHMRTIRYLCGKVNNAPFRAFAAGEVLYLGASGRCGPDLVWTLTHKFAVGENLYAVPVSPPEIILPYKGAWEYLWCAYAPSKDTGRIVQQPVSAYVERVYDSADFTLLGLGA